MIETKKAQFIIQVEMIDGGEAIMIHDLSHFHPMAMFIKRLENDGLRYLFRGEHADVIVIAPFQEFTEQQCMKIANLFVRGQYQVWSYATEQWTQGIDWLKGD